MGLHCAWEQVPGGDATWCWLLPSTRSTAHAGPCNTLVCPLIAWHFLAAGWAAFLQRGHLLAVGSAGKAQGGLPNARGQAAASQKRAAAPDLGSVWLQLYILAVLSVPSQLSCFVLLQTPGHVSMFLSTLCILPCMRPVSVSLGPL